MKILELKCLSKTIQDFQLNGAISSSDITKIFYLGTLFIELVIFKRNL